MEMYTSIGKFKASYSINVQGSMHWRYFIDCTTLVDYKKRFIDLEVGWPGSVGDGRVFANSHLNNVLGTWLSQFPSRYLATSYVDGVVVEEEVPPFILGDSTYPNRKHFVTTFKTTECRDPLIAKLNKHLGGARYHVENAFAILRGRFQIFQAPLQCARESVESAILLMTSCFVLHNFLIDMKDNSGDWTARNEALRDEIGGHEEDEEEDMELDVMPTVQDAEPTRALLIRQMCWLHEEDVILD